MAQSSPNSGFEDVDRASDSDWFVKCLDKQYASGLLERNKQRTFELLDIQGGQRILDAGCGTGVDTLKMATLVGDGGHVVGVDLSAAMVLQARERSYGANLPVSFCQGDIYHLGFPDNCFDLCRSDKTFQHLSEPRRALAELVRVTKPGGKIVIADPDHDSLIIDTPYDDVNRRFAQFRSDHMPQGGIAHQLYAMFKEFGLVNVTAEPLTTIFTDYEVKKVTSPYLKEIRIAQEYDAVTPKEAEQWAAYLEAAIGNGRFFCMQTYVVTMGFKP
ncbi:MAG TPA: methyltransferase domain-containing protein [Anaerolineae bacterium]